jgi:hypothetical protein
MDDITKPIADSKSKKAETPKSYPLIVQIIGIIIVAEFLAVLTWILIFEMDASKDYWTRLTFLFNSLQSVAFAVVGALFGTQVQKAGTEIEKQRADKAEQIVQPSKELALLVKDSSPDLTSIFTNNEMRSIIKPTMQDDHAKMQALATQILTT